MTDRKPTLAQTAQTAANAMAYAIHRVQSQLEFAEVLCVAHPREAAAWRKLLERSQAGVQVAIATGRLDRVEAAVGAAERTLAPLRRAAKSYTVHLVGHAHIDMNWMWSWPETCAVVNDTFTTVLKLMDEFPEFTLSQSQAAIYGLVETHNPALFARIRERVAEGRWEITASHWVEGDKNMAGAEALCRHLLYSRRFMQERFGLKPEDIAVDWSPDTFGHAATVPTYLAQGGVTRYYGHRFGNTVLDRPILFWWEGPDGARVLVRNDSANGYNGLIDETLGRRVLDFARVTGVKGLMFVYGVGDHGGGPTRRDIRRAIDMMDWPIFPTLTFSTSAAFFAQVEREGRKLPVLTGELQFEFTGCYTTQTLIKKCNRLAENHLADTEAATTLAWSLLGAPYPAGKLAEGWRDTIFTHFHDILPGSGVHDTRTYAHGMFQRTAGIVSMLETQALRAIAARVDTATGFDLEIDPTPPPNSTSGQGSGVGFGTATGGLSGAEQSCGEGPRPFMIFNPTGHARAEVVTVTIWESDPRMARSWLRTQDKNRLQVVPLHVVTPSGKRIPVQRTGSGIYWNHQFVKLAFPTESIPAFGWGLYTIVEGEVPALAPGVKATGPDNVCKYAILEESNFGLENAHTRMRLDPLTGGIRSLVDKRSGLDLVAPGQAAAVLEFGIERPHGMSAWSLAEYMGPAQRFEVVTVERKSSGPHVASIEVRLRRGETSFKLTYELRANDPHLYVNLDGTWVERGDAIRGVPALRMAFPLALQNPTARYEIPFGAVERDLNRGEEVPALQWAHVRGKVDGDPAGFLLLNDCKHGHSLDNGTLRLTLIRSSYDPDPIPEVGDHHVRLALAPIAGELSVADAIRRGNTLNHALRLVGTDVHAGELPRVASPVTSTAANVIVTCLKKAEDADALIVRVFETAGKRTTAKLNVDEKLLGQVRGAAEIDLLERLVKNGTAKAGKGTVSVVVPAHGIASVRIDCRR